MFDRRRAPYAKKRISIPILRIESYRQKDSRFARAKHRVDSGETLRSV